MKGKRKRIYRLVAVCLALLVAFTGLLTVQAAGVAKPTKLSAKANDNVSITLQWTAAKKVSGYQVYTAGSKSGKYTLLATTSATKYTHSNLKGGKTYYYKVRAYKTVKKKKRYSGYTAVVQATAVQYAAQKSLRSLNSKVDGMIRRVTALEQSKTVGDLQQTVLRQEQLLADQQSALETLQQTVATQDDSLQSLQQTVTAQSQKITDLEQQVQALSGAKAYWQGKKWVAFGDSISAGFQLDDPDTQLYSHLIAKDLGLHLVSGSMHAMNSMGYTVTAGTAVGQHSMPAYVNADKNEDADLVTIFAGTNDFGRSVAMPLGTMADDANTESFYGRLKLTCDLLSAKYPNALVILVTPLPRHDCADGTVGTVEPTKTLVDYADAIRQVAALYSFPVLDLTRESGMQMRSKAFRDTYMADNIHPNAAGHAKFIAPALERFILQHTPVM